MMIRENEMIRLMDAIAYTVTRCFYTEHNYEPSSDYVGFITRKLAIDFCNDQNITDVIEEDENFNDEVDETFYDPYSGCDIYENDTFDEGW